MSEELFKTEKITDKIKRIALPGNVFAYFAEGEKEAALIDTGYGVGSLKAYVSSLTKLPVTVIATHGHLDHIGGASEFDQVYIPEEDLGLAMVHSDVHLRADNLRQSGVQIKEDQLTPSLNQKQMVPYKGEKEFDLDGMKIRMLPLEGHTPGCHCALFEKERILLLGDACNSFAFMQLDGCLSIEEYHANLIDFKAKYDDLYDQVIYSHPHNFGDKSVIDEMIELTDKIMTPDFKGIDVSSLLGDDVYIAKAVDQNYRNTDGTIANIAYKPGHICR